MLINNLILSLNSNQDSDKLYGISDISHFNHKLMKLQHYNKDIK